MTTKAKPETPAGMRRLLISVVDSYWDEDGDPAVTVELARDCLQRDPNCGPAWTYLGMALTALDRYREARVALKRALRILLAQKERGPRVLRATYSQLGHLYDEWGKHRQAQRWYREAMRCEPRRTNGYIHLGHSLARQGGLAEAAKVFRKATRLTEGNPDEAWLNLGLVLRARERYGEAKGCFEKAIKLDPAYDEAKRALKGVRQALRIVSERKADGRGRERRAMRRKK